MSDIPEGLLNVALVAIAAMAFLGAVDFIADSIRRFKAALQRWRDHQQR